MVTFISCKKEVVPVLNLPEESQTGKNTLGFLLNDKVWANYGRRCTTLGGCHDNKVTASLYKQPNGDYDLSITGGFNADTIDQAFTIGMDNVTAAGTYALDSSAKRLMRFESYESDPYYKEYHNRASNTCFITITKLDTITKIISGTFTGVLYNSLSMSDSIKIEQGRFDSQLDFE